MAYTPAPSPVQTNTLRVIEASYGKNCGVAAGYLTDYFQKKVLGLETFSFSARFNDIKGDPAYLCPKDFEITYDCNDGNTQYIKIEGKDQENYTLNMKCDTSRPVVNTRIPPPSNVPGTMDANSTCQLVSVNPFVDYNQVVYSDGTLQEFSITAPYTRPAPNRQIDNFYTRYFFGTPKPGVLRNGASSIVKSYLGYPLGSPDYRATPLAATQWQTIVETIVRSGDLCATSDIYNTSQYVDSAKLNGLSLTTLYLTLSKDISEQDKVNIRSQINVLQNKNMLFFTFFVYEYCYYRTMYNTLLTQYFLEYSTIANPSMPNIPYLKTSEATSVLTSADPPGQASRLDGIVNVMARLNSRLVDMRRLLTAIQIYYSDALTSYQRILADSSHTGSDSYIEDKVIALRSDEVDLTQLQDQSKFRQAVMDYTKQKNRYSGLLLGVYTFLNIAAIAIIFTIRE